eukprot:scaffold21761_cov157-Isochrysis_galbana.AAC.1
MDGRPCRPPLRPPALKYSGVRATGTVSRNVAIKYLAMQVFQNDSKLIGTAFTRCPRAWAALSASGGSCICSKCLYFRTRPSIRLCPRPCRPRSALCPMSYVREKLHTCMPPPQHLVLGPIWQGGGPTPTSISITGHGYGPHDAHKQSSTQRQLCSPSAVI